MITKPATQVEDYQHIWIDDPALDVEHEDFEGRYNRYLETGDYAALPLKQSEKPAVFVMSHVRGRAKRCLQDHMRRTMVNSFSVESVASACAIAVQSVTGFCDAKGRPIDLRHHIDPQTHIRCLTDESLAELDDVPGLVNDLGLRVIREMTPSPK